MKRWTLSALALGVALGVFGAASAAGAQTAAPPVYVYVDGKLDGSVLVHGNRAYVPLSDFKDPQYFRYGFDKGYTIVTKTTTGDKLRLKAGSSKATVDGKTVTLDSPVLSAKGRTFVSLQFLKKYLGATMTYGNRANLVFLRTPTGQYNYDLLRTADLDNARSVAVRLPLEYTGGKLTSNSRGSRITYTFPKGEATRYLMERDGITSYVVITKDGIAEVKWQKGDFGENEIGKKPDDFGDSYYFAYEEKDPEKITYGSTNSSFGGQRNDLGTYLVDPMNWTRGVIFQKIHGEDRTDGIALP
ncbi:copper amine oxidase N-terminal domain-containing protein [Cohnella zeiphila]|uniref:Copper amine oxidase N-terminal domain-containing protein n=1 Tax=Cohnella zeiphila TaxID=2761120 RepID=A0A7X0VYI8_9BACL|nr:copper amine oxidase N-terminal domain-containing protein [Cohnella zeiphila]MBB6735066.1 copper amine oxidase N-terminal domain-containing protein [Cohnella zeiphila]